MLEQIRLRFREFDQLSKHFDIDIDVAENGYARASMPFETKHQNGLQNLHGAATFALADTAFAACALGIGKLCVSINAGVNFVKAGKSGPIVAEATILSTSRKLITVDIKVYDGHNELIATSQITGYILETIPIASSEK